MALERYLAEEIALDHADGLISRREALRKLGLMGMSAASASTLLAACARGDVSTPPEAGTPTPPVSPTAGTAGTERITFPGPGVTLQGAWAKAAEARGSVLVIHENRGLNDHIRSVAARFARDGYSALAIDLLSERGGTAAVGEDDAPVALSQIPMARFVALMRAGLDEMERREPGRKLAIIGFCFGGGTVWGLLNAGEQRLAAAAPFYGSAPSPADFSGSKAAVLAVYAESDDRVNATQDAAVEGMRAAGLTHEVKTYPGTSHAFFNDTGQRHNPEAAAQAYEDVLGWFGRYLA